MVITDTEPERLALLPASASGPPRGLRGGGALLRRSGGEEFRDVQEQTCPGQQGALDIQGAVEVGGGGL